MNRRNAVRLGYNAALVLIFGTVLWFILPATSPRLLVIVVATIALLLVWEYQAWRVRQRSRAK